jgi:hypothetical protein
MFTIVWSFFKEGIRKAKREITVPALPAIFIL